jgi:predicted regulator of Ras-like GTPase activity (Roadblock/LC7/MglB family)
VPFERWPIYFEGWKLVQPGAEEVPNILKEVLKKLSNKSPILGAAILSVEGLPLVSHFHGRTEEVAVAAMVAGIHSAGEQTVRELRQGNLKSIIIQGNRGATLVISMPSDYLLAVTAPENARLGLIFNDAKRAAREASKILRELA